MFKVCPICQQQVPVYEWAVHEMQHRGQPQMPPQQGRTGPSAVPQAAGKAPRIYHHPRCGHATALPEAAVYAQLQDPFCSTDQAYCSGCKGYVASSELFWEGTSESLLSYDRRQKAEYIRAHALNPNDFVWDSTGPVRRKSQSNWGAIVGVCVGGLALVFLLGPIASQCGRCRTPRLPGGAAGCCPDGAAAGAQHAHGQAESASRHSRPAG
jgi:hypothetical protein